MYAVVLPTLDVIVEKKLGLSAQMKDLQLARFSILISVLGFGILFAAPSLRIIILGKYITSYLFRRWTTNLSLFQLSVY